jgi:succinyl-CoA synthetase beta subunit
MYNLFVETDCSLVEVNPLIVTDKDEVKALDAKINFDDNAEFRHKEFKDLHDPTEEEPSELEAKEWGFSFVKLDGNIGCLVNGAGLAMSTMDIIKHHGAEPANFLDVGGGATVEQVTQAFKMILRDENVKAILVNIFGGIMKCDTIADGIMVAAKEVGIKVPLVVRLEGTNVELGKKMIEESGLNISTATTMKDAALKVVELI